jgi:hypothetical protein
MRDRITPSQGKAKSCGGKYSFEKGCETAFPDQETKEKKKKEKKEKKKRG